MGLVVIAGAGVGGPALACLLRGLGRRVVLLEARAAVDDGEGAFLGVAPNGMRALERIGIARELAAIGHPCSAFRFRNAAGRIVGAIDRRRDRERFGHALTMVRRGDLHRLLARRAEEAGAELRLSCAALDARFDPSGRPQVRAADGDLDADVLVGADGLGSMIRRSLFPEAPPPRDSGWIDAGGFAPGTFGLEPGVNEMVFGARGFFGAFATSAGETWWFSNGAAPSSPLAGEPLREHLLATHTNDGAWVGEVIRATPRVLGAWPLRDLPRVPRWSSGRAALLGDAAHAMSPSAGQGASMALEDAVALARSLRDVPDVPAALAAYERARRPRVARVFAHAERASAGKVVPGPIAACLRDLFLPIGLRFGARAQDEGYAWEESW